MLKEIGSFFSRTWKRWRSKTFEINGQVVSLSFGHVDNYVVQKFTVWDKRRDKFYGCLFFIHRGQLRGLNIRTGDTVKVKLLKYSHLPWIRSELHNHPVTGRTICIDFHEVFAMML